MGGFGMGQPWGTNGPMQFKSLRNHVKTCFCLNRVFIVIIHMIMIFIIIITIMNIIICFYYHYIIVLLGVSM